MHRLPLVNEERGSIVLTERSKSLGARLVSGGTTTDTVRRCAFLISDAQSCLSNQNIAHRLCHCRYPGTEPEDVGHGRTAAGVRNGRWRTAAAGTISLS